MRRLKHTFLATAAIAAVALGSITSADAQVFGGIVYDPSNYTQNLLTAVRTLEMINNQLKQLTNEAQMLVNQAKELTNLPYTAKAALMARLNEIDALVKSARSIAYDVTTADAAFSSMFPEDYAAFSNLAMDAASRDHWEQSSRALHDAVVMQAKITETVAADLPTLDELVAESEKAIGGLQVSQAGNQLIALQTKQAMQTAELLAVQHRAETMERARQLQMEERARITQLRFVGDGAAYAAK